jgi:hypothetical protein
MKLVVLSPALSNAIVKLGFEHRFSILLIFRVCVFGRRSMNHCTITRVQILSVQIESFTNPAQNVYIFQFRPYDTVLRMDISITRPP